MGIKILVSDPVDPQGIAVLKNNPRFELTEDRSLNGLSSFQAWIVRSETKITRAELEMASSLKLIGRAGTGVDNIDVEEATKRGILVLNVPGGNSISVAEHAIALMLALVRKIVPADRAVKAGKWRDKTLQGRELYGKTLGLIGFGRVGREVARRATAFGMKVIAHDPYLTEILAAEAGIALVSLDDLLAQSDLISLHTALTAQTRHLINAASIAKMKPGVLLINTSRGEVIDEGALAQAIESGYIGGCALDVFAQEPPKDNPLLRLEDRVVFTPHLAASTYESQARVAAELARSVADYFEQGLVRGCVNLPPGFEPSVLERLGAHMSLSERMGRFLGQYLPGPWTRAELCCPGRINEKERRVLLQAALRGIMSCALGDQVNLVNAAVFSKERRLSYSTGVLESPECGDILLTLTSAQGKSSSLSGRVEADGGLRIVRIGHLTVDVTPEGTLVTLENIDKPGMIGKVGTLLGRNSVNIADMRVGRQRQGGAAIMVLTIDGKIPPSVLQALAKIEGITRVSLILL